MKPRIYRRHPLNMHLERPTIAEGVSKQNSHPFKVMQKRQSCGFLYGYVYLSYAFYAYQSYWLCECYAEKHQLPSMTSKCSRMCKRLMIYDLLVIQFKRESENQRNHTLRM